MSPTNTSWTAACDSAVIISAYAAQSGDSYPDPAQRNLLAKMTVIV